MAWSRKLLLLTSVCLSICAIGQDARSLDQLAAETMTSLTTQTDIPDSLYISLQEYHMLIERQPMSNSDKSNFKSEVNSFHEGQEDEFYGAMQSFQQIYTHEIERGATIELDSLWSQPMEGTRNIYEIKFQLSFTYPDEEEPVLSFLETMVGAVRRRYSFISPITESYE